ncbi:hypothetical protein [Sinomonas sp. G460-2]|uniref:hypothetical protein n=1 Tax=Sinomonas sp. G460-2 TaxID=3393464 RepID=UPI0039EED532
MSESTTDGEPRVENPDGGREPIQPADGAPRHTGQEPGAPHSKVGHFMRTMGHLRSVYGPAAHRDPREAEAHGHNPEDVKEFEELEGIDVKTDSEGHHYGVRKEPPAE